MTYQQWIADFLNAIGAPQTPQNVAFMNAWIAKESGQYPIGYGWNPLNTTQAGPGSYGGGAQGNIQFFPSYQAGLAANVATITNGYYGDLLSELRGGAPSTAVPYHGLSVWGTGSLSGVTGSPSTASSGSSSGAPSSAPSSSSSSSSSLPSWLQTIHDEPIVGPATAEIVSSGVVGAFAIALLLLGGIWLILGNQTARTAVVTTAKTAAKAAAA